MITTVTLNAAIDKTYYVKGHQLGWVHRVASQLDEPGGKGNNVAKIVHLLGGEVTATGFIGGSSGAFIEERLAERGIHTAFVKVPGQSRICLNIIDEDSGQSTELLEQGPTIQDDHIQALKATLRRLSERSAVVVLAGSLPQGAPAELYAELIGIIHTSGSRAFLDTSGAALSFGLQARPHFAKPNEQELADWLGRGQLEESDWAAAAAQLAAAGIAQACVTLGGSGSVSFIYGALYRAIPPEIQAVNTVGCGDAFVAGMAYGEELGVSAPEKLAMATAAAAANAMSHQAGHLIYDQYLRCLEQVQIIRL
ncbi:1-phosphofructokinase family hexose kinase [Paenibacillus sp. GD4]|uniref:1-phosphofructokinase family hexose kinase n=1 Tax=Paenibacillus sp. GD4 TaxID=3068890 RepID=UPI00279668B3|nr:1-phosphofructokinase family hexose kinase [Paenibacillus sp. GD4]MDQ1912775.1 1-phosphofructokinase family hexose kinase [Paenibacillus sp. GD4]